MRSSQGVMIAFGILVVVLSYQNCGPQIAEVAPAALSSKRTSWSSYQASSGPVIIAGERTCGWQADTVEVSYKSNSTVRFAMSNDFPAGSSVALQVLENGAPATSGNNLIINADNVVVYHYDRSDRSTIQLSGKVVSSNGTTLCSASPISVRRVPYCEMLMQAGTTTTVATASKNVVMNLSAEQVSKSAEEIAFFILPPMGLTLDSTKQAVRLTTTMNGDDQIPVDYSAKLLTGNSNSRTLKSFANITETASKAGLKMVFQGIGGTGWHGSYSFRAKVLGSGDYVICETDESEADRAKLVINGPAPSPSPSPTASPSPSPSPCATTVYSETTTLFKQSVCSDTNHRIYISNTEFMARGDVPNCGEDAAYKSTKIGNFTQIDSVTIKGTYTGPCSMVDINGAVIASGTINDTFTSTYDPNLSIQLPAISRLQNQGRLVAVCGENGSQWLTYNLEINVKGRAPNSNCGN